MTEHTTENRTEEINLGNALEALNRRNVIFLEELVLAAGYEEKINPAALLAAQLTKKDSFPSEEDVDTADFDIEYEQVFTYLKRAVGNVYFVDCAYRRAGDVLLFSKGIFPEIPPYKTEEDKVMHYLSDLLHTRSIQPLLSLKDIAVGKTKAGLMKRLLVPLIPGVGTTGMLYAATGNLYESAAIGAFAGVLAALVIGDFCKEIRGKDSYGLSKVLRTENDAITALFQEIHPQKVFHTLQ